MIGVAGEGPLTHEACGYRFVWPARAETITVQRAGQVVARVDAVCLPWRPSVLAACATGWLKQSGW